MDKFKIPFYNASNQFVIAYCKLVFLITLYEKARLYISHITFVEISVKCAPQNVGECEDGVRVSPLSKFGSQKGCIQYSLGDGGWPGCSQPYAEVCVGSWGQADAVFPNFSAY